MLENTHMSACKAIAAVLLLFLAQPTSGIDYARLNVPVEVRAIWLNANAIPKTADGISILLDSYSKANINLIFPEVIARGYTVYDSKYLPRDPRFRDSPDPLPEIIKQAHARGIEVHPWVWVFRAGYTQDRGGILTAHPEWVELSIDGNELSPGGSLWVSPAVPAARDFIAELLAELVGKYDVDGLHLDYIRYESESTAPYGYSPFSRALFAKQYGLDPAQAQPFTLERYFWNKFRERQINTFVQRIARQTRALKPHVLISAAVDPNIGNARLYRLQNWTHWLDNKWLDFVVPMAYSSRDDYFQRLLQIVSEATAGKSLVVSGIAPYRHEAIEQTIAQIAAARELVPGGQALFPASAIKTDHLSALKAGPYSQAASLPFRETRSKIEALSAYAERLRTQGRYEEADYACRSAALLASFLNYKDSHTAYVRPTPPPVRVEENVAPLPEISVKHVSVSPVIDGVFNEAEWATSSRASLSRDSDGQVASAQTVLLICRDHENLYVAFRCAEPLISKVRATAADRDSPVFQDDSVEVFLKPAGSGRDYFHFAVNTAGATFDEKNTDSQWNAKWTAVSKIAEYSYTVELSIPLAALSNSAPSKGSVWTANFARNRTAAGRTELLVWSVPYGTLHNPERFGTIRFE